MEQDNGMLVQIDRLLGKYDWLKSARSEGAEIDTMESGILLIRKPVNLENNRENPTARVAAQGYTEEVVVPDLNLLLGSSIHKSGGELIARIVYKYDYNKDDDQWLPEMIFYEEYGTNEVTKSDYIRKTTYYFENYSLKTY